MLIANTNNVSPLPFAPAAPSSAGAAPGENSAFARMLSAQKQPGERPPEVQHQTNDSKLAQAKDNAPGRPAEKAADKPAEKVNDQGTDEAQDSDDAQAGSAEATPAVARRGTARNQPKLALRARESTIGKPTAKPTADASDATKADGAKDGDKKDAGQPGAPDIAAQMNPSAPAAQPLSLPAGEAATPLADGKGKMAAVAGDAADAAALSTATADASVGKGRDSSRADVVDAKHESPFAQVLKAEAADTRHAVIDEKIAAAKESQEQRFELPAARDVHAVSHLSAPQAASGTDASAAPVSVDVPTPVTSPEFSEALGVQVSVLARDGVQHAQLHLNPAEMGPISVQIALDGTKAQVDFGADSLATRQVIESGLPELASALRDAGFTLAGGGVSQHSQSRQDSRDDSRQAGGSAPRRIGGASETAAPVRRATVKMSQGGVDLYA